MSAEPSPTDFVSRWKLGWLSPSEVAELVRAARAEERERCAQIANDNLGRHWVVAETPKDIAARIRLTDTPETD